MGMRLVTSLYGVKLVRKLRIEIRVRSHSNTRRMRMWRSSGCFFLFEADNKDEVEVSDDEVVVVVDGAEDE